MAAAGPATLAPLTTTVDGELTAVVATVLLEPGYGRVVPADGQVVTVSVSMSVVTLALLGYVLVIGADDAAGDEVGDAVSETRLPVMLYAAAHWARFMPSGQHHVSPEESWVQ